MQLSRHLSPMVLRDRILANCYPQSHCCLETAHDVTPKNSRSKCFGAFHNTQKEKKKIRLLLLYATILARTNEKKRRRRRRKHSARIWRPARLSRRKLLSSVTLLPPNGVRRVTPRTLCHLWGRRHRHGVSPKWQGPSSFWRKIPFRVRMRRSLSLCVSPTHFVEP